MPAWQRAINLQRTRERGLQISAALTAHRTPCTERAADLFDGCGAIARDTRGMPGAAAPETLRKFSQSVRSWYSDRAIRVRMLLTKPIRLRHPCQLRRIGRVAKSATPLTNLVFETIRCRPFLANTVFTCMSTLFLPLVPVCFDLGRIALSLWNGGSEPCLSISVACPVHCATFLRTPF